MTKELIAVDYEDFVNKPSVRDQFAMAALTGLISNSTNQIVSDGTWTIQKLFSEVSYNYADAMMKAREVKS